MKGVSILLFYREGNAEVETRSIVVDGDWKRTRWSRRAPSHRRNGDVPRRVASADRRRAAEGKPWQW